MSPARRRPRTTPLRSGELFHDVAEPARGADRAVAELFVLTSDEELVRWNRSRIGEVLVREADLDRARANAISAKVEEQLLRAGLRAVSTSVIRELVGAELMAHGLTAQRARHARLGVSLYDVGRILTGDTAAARPLDPTSTSHAIARRVKREYALAGVFSERVADGHRRGDLHIHDLDAVDRPESLWLHLDGLQRAGGSGWMGRAQPARDAEELFRQTARLVASLTGHVARPVGIEALNVSLAPYLTERSPRELADAMSALLDELAQAAWYRGERGPALEASICWDLPAELARSEAVGPGGAPAGRCAGHAETARRVATALIEAVARHGDAMPVPDLVVTIGPEFYRTPGHLGFLETAVESACRIGVPRFRLVRPGAAAPDPPQRRPAKGRAAPLRMVTGHRVCTEAVVGTVSLDLPRLGYLAGDDVEAVEARLLAVLDLAARAHLEKRVFLEELLARDQEGPLGFLMDRDGTGPILSLDDSVHRIAVCGLNELAEGVTGRPLASSDPAMDFARRFLDAMNRHVATLSRKHKLRFRVAGAPAPEPAARFAKLDLRYHSPAAGHLVKGDLRTGQVSYTPGVALGMDNDASPFPRLVREGELHNRAPAAAAVVVPPSALQDGGARLIMEAYAKTACREIVVR